MTTPSDVTIGIDNAARHLGVTVDSLKAARRVVEEKQAARDAWGYTEAGRPPRIMLGILQADADLDDARARYAECERIVGVARRQWSDLVGAARRARHEARLRQAQAGLQPVVALLEEDRLDQDATLATLGLAQGQGEHPVGAAAHVSAVLDIHLRRLHPPAPTLPPPPAPRGSAA